MVRKVGYVGHSKKKATRRKRADANAKQREITIDRQSSVGERERCHIKRGIAIAGDGSV